MQGDNTKHCVARGVCREHPRSLHTSGEEETEHFWEALSWLAEGGRELDQPTAGHYFCPLHPKQGLPRAFRPLPEAGEGEAGA